jgi:BirA family biotin operon repressor/biotin-[acetyl-CoA-carboxylase] ligase
MNPDLQSGAPQEVAATPVDELTLANGLPSCLEVTVRWDIPPFQATDAALDRAVSAGLLEPGSAQRVRIASCLAQTLGPDASNQTAVSGQALGRTLGLSRAAVHKHVDHLRSLGFVLESGAGQGYRLAAPFANLLATEAALPFILAHVDWEEPWRAGLPYFYREQCDSTNRVLRAALDGATLPSGAVAVTDHQTHGRGRLDRVWHNQPGKDLMFSVLLRPALAPGQAHLLSLAAALAVAETVESLLSPTSGVTSSTGERTQVKWPNDVMLDGGKLCGILLEGSMDSDRLHWAIAGVGLNVNSDSSALGDEIGHEDEGGLDHRPRPASLRARLGADVPRAPLLAALLRRLTVRWTELEGPGGAALLLAALRERDALAGLPVQVFGGSDHQEVVVAGEAAGIGPEGQLLVRTPSNEVVAVFAGDVSLRDGMRGPASTEYR